MLEAILGGLVPNQAGTLWFGAILLFAVFGDLRQWRSPRNAVLLGLLALAPALVDIVQIAGQSKPIAKPTFAVIYLLTMGYAVWGFLLGTRVTPLGFRPNFRQQWLLVLLGGVLVLNAAIIFTRPPDDSGVYTNLGAQRWTETGVLPYGDPYLKGPDAPAFGAAATYGPLMYASHVVFQKLTGGGRNPPDISPLDPRYRRPPELATRLTTLTFHLTTLTALFVILRALASADVALAVTVVYAGMPYVLGLGGREYGIVGLQYASHVIPGAFVLLALAARARPALAGGLLAAGAGTLFYPAFMMPAWLGWFSGRSRADAMWFLLGFAGIGTVIGLGVIWFTNPAPGESVVSLFMESTLEHQEGVGAHEYGTSIYSFWGTHPEFASFWQKPVFGSTSLFKPTFLAYATLVGLSFFIARGRTIVQLAGISAGLAAAVQLWKTHATGSYVEWYLPLLMIALFARPPTGEEARPPGKRGGE